MMNRMQLVFAVVVALGLWLVAGEMPASAPEAGRHAVPDEGTVSKSRQLIRSVYEQEYKAAKQSGEPATLITELVRSADTIGDAVEQYAMLLEAEDLATQHEDAATALAIVDKRARAFDIDGLKEQADKLERLAGPKVSADTALFEQAMQTAKQAAVVERFEIATNTASLVLNVAKAIDRAQKTESRKQQRRPADNEIIPMANGPALIKAARELQARIGEHKKSFTAYRQSLTVLENNPDDPEANAAAGIYLCLVAQKWDKGLPHLGKGEVNVLSVLAAEETTITKASPPEPTKLFTLADRWWTAAEASEVVSGGGGGEAVRLHAASIYHDLLGQLRGPLESRLAETRLRPYMGMFDARTKVPQVESGDEAKDGWFNPELWRLAVWDGEKWIRKGVNDVPVRVRGESFEVTNTITEHNTANLESEQLLTGDFTIGLSVRGAMGVCIRPQDGSDRSFGTGAFLADGKVHDVEISRRGKEIAITVDAKRIEPFVWNNSPPEMAGYLSILISRDATATISHISLGVAGSVKMQEARRGQEEMLVKNGRASPNLALPNGWSQHERFIEGIGQTRGRGEGAPGDACHLRLIPELGDTDFSLELVLSIEKLEGTAAHFLFCAGNEKGRFGLDGGSTNNFFIEGGLFNCERAQDMSSHAEPGKAHRFLISRRGGVLTWACDGQEVAAVRLKETTMGQFEIVPFRGHVRVYEARLVRIVTVQEGRNAKKENGAKASAVVVRYVGSLPEVAELRSGSQYFTNRHYTLGILPAELEGLSFTRRLGGAARDVTITLPNGVTVYVLVDSDKGVNRNTASLYQALSEGGWLRLKDIPLQGVSKNTPLAVFRKDAQRVESITLSAGDFSGVGVASRALEVLP